MLRLLQAFLLMLLLASFASPAQENASRKDMSGHVVHQLRIYEIFEKNKAAFHTRFHNRAIPIMRRYGFKILAMWESRSEARTEFVYLLEWKDAATMERQWKAFLADEEWNRVKRETAAGGEVLVGDVTSRKLELVDYSPGFPSIAGSGE